MTRTALVRGAAVSVIVGGVLAVGTAPAFAWYTTGPNGETICEFGGTYPDCNTEPTPGTSEGGGGATATPTPSESPSTPADTPTPTESPSPGTSEGGGGATGVPSPSTVAVVGGTGTTTTSGAAVSAAELPFTGFEVGAAAAIGLAALGAGTVFIVGSRRRRGTSTSA